jgi:phage I-like protein
MKKIATGIIVCHSALPVGPELEGWYHLMPLGEHPGTMELDGKRVKTVEVIDDESVSSIMVAHRERAARPGWPGYLVDIEHFSHNAEGSTAAYAWGVELEYRTGEKIPEAERGIWVKLHKTPLGAGSIGSIYKYLSSVNHMEHIGGERWRPVTIEDIGLTNRPAYKTLVPATHRDRNPQEEKEDSDMLDKLRKLLAKHSVTVADDAGEDVVLAAVDSTIATLHREKQVAAEKGADLLTAAQADLATARHRVQELETAELGREADAFVAEHRESFTDEAAIRRLYIEHRDAARGMIGLIRKPAAETKTTPRALHRDGTQTPDNPDAASASADARRSLEQREYVGEIAVKHRCTHQQAWIIAANNKPELFGAEVAG